VGSWPTATEGPLTDIIGSYFPVASNLGSRRSAGGCLARTVAQRCAPGAARAKIAAKSVHGAAESQNRHNRRELGGLSYSAGTGHVFWGPALVTLLP
jgi:hypothetical protein